MMSQRNVEKVIGRLVTDEGFRRRFAEDRDAMVQEILDHGLDLNPCERRALLALDPQRIAQFAEQLDPCIQKVELGTHGAPEGRRHEVAPARSADHGLGTLKAPDTAVPSADDGPRARGRTDDDRGQGDDS